MKISGLFSAQNTLLSEEEMCEKLKLKSWPEKQYTTGFKKQSVDSVNVEVKGVVDDVRGYPSHIDLDRALLLYPTRFYDILREKFPQCKESLNMGSMGENVCFEMSNVGFCIGDVLKIGTCIVVVTYHRIPCPKIDARHNIVHLEGQIPNPETSITEYCKCTGFAGIFVKIITSGTINMNDRVEIVNRPNPEWTVQTVAFCLFSCKSAIENNEMFTNIMNIDCLGKAMKKKAKCMIVESVKSNGKDHSMDFQISIMIALIAFFVMIFLC